MTPPPRILLVEEDDAIILMTGYLRGQGYEVDGASTILAARTLAASHYHYALLDLALPDGTSDRLIDPIRATSPDCLILVITGHPEAASLEQLRMRGVEVMLKPVALPDLIKRLSDHAMTMSASA